MTRYPRENLIKVFLSWSGQKSLLVAEALRDWLPDVVNAVVPWMSSEDIEKGAVGTQAIAEELNGSSFGIICLTNENQHRPWINFEAGALSKAVGDEKARVATLLVDIDRPASVLGPLSAFQATMPNLRDIKRLVVDIDRATGSPRPAERVERVVENLWNPLQEKFEDVAALEEQQESDRRSPEDVLDEILELARSTSRALSNISSVLPPDSQSGAEQKERVTQELARQKAYVEATNDIALLSLSGEMTSRLMPGSVIALSSIEFSPDRRVEAERMAKYHGFAVNWRPTHL